MKISVFWKPALWLVFICYGLFVPSDKLPAKNLYVIPHFDKLIHFMLFFILCLLLFNPLKINNLKHKFFAPLITVLLALILESAQHVVSATRTSNLYDFLANVAGIFACLFVYLFFIAGKKWEKHF